MHEEANDVHFFPPAIELDVLFKRAVQEYNERKLGVQSDKEEVYEDDEEAIAYPTHTEALKALEKLHMYAVGQGDVDTINGELDMETCKSEIIRHPKEHRVQTKIKDCFRNS